MNLFQRHRITRRIAFAYKSLLRMLVAQEPLEVVGSPHSRGENSIEAVYIINLDRQPGRWAMFSREARRQRVQGGERLSGYCHRIPAVDGKVLNLNEADGLVNLTYPVDAQYYVDPDPRLLGLIRDREIPVAMSREEIAVALSHIKAWRRIVSEGLSHALVLEDDVFFEPQFASQLNRSWRELPRTPEGEPHFDILYLSFREVERGAQWDDFSEHLRCPVRGYWWLSGYVLSNAGARKLLDLLPVVGPVDLWMNHRFADLNVYSSPKSVIFQRTDLQSDNRYSILPLLSQIGIQSDKTHLLLEHTKGRRPVICIGYGQESAAILETALALMGYRCCNDRWSFLSPNIERLLQENLPLLFDAYIHVGSVSRHVAWVKQLHPSAVFLVAPSPNTGSELSSEDFHSLTTELVSNKEAALVFDTRDAAGWQPLCQFLQCKTPAHRFPTDGQSALAPDLDGDLHPIPMAHCQMQVQEHDVHPWIVPYERLAAFGLLREPRAHGNQAGVFNSTATDSFTTFDNARWIALEDSFPSNLAQFRRENVSLSAAGCQLTLDKRQAGDRMFAAGSFRSEKSHQYGRYEARMMAARCSGVVTAFFLHRTDPWQEIDVEILGDDTTKLLINVYFNPGEAGTSCNFGNRGTPVVIDLWFDASESFHTYAIEWEPHEVRWFVDGQLVHVRGPWEPTPIPNLPMEIFSSIWPPRSTELAGVLSSASLPVSSQIARIEVCEWMSGEQTLRQHVM